MDSLNTIEHKKNYGIPYHLADRAFLIIKVCNSYRDKNKIERDCVMDKITIYNIPDSYIKYINSMEVEVFESIKYFLKTKQLSFYNSIPDISSSSNHLVIDFNDFDHMSFQ